MRRYGWAMRRYGRSGVGRRLAVSAVVLAALLGLGFLIHSLAGGGAAASASGVAGINGGSIDAPKDPALTLTVPAMDRVREVPVVTAPADDAAALGNGVMHVAGTGYPWQEGANVYIAGHRLGYEGTGSYRIFHDLDALQNGDEIILSDGAGTRYTYEVFTKFVVDPGDYHVTYPVPGRSVVSLQTCTLPDYARRLVVQAELKGVD